MKEIPENANASIDTVNIGGAPIACISKGKLLQYIERRIASRNHGYVCFCEAHLCVRATYEEDVRKCLSNAALVLADGVGMTVGARLLGKPVPERLPGPTVILDVCRYGMQHDIRHFFYGGADGVANALAAKLKARFPVLQVAGSYCPPFRPLTEEEDRQVVKLINESKADIVWVGLGAPKQEKWMYDHLGRIEAPLMMGVGAAFDFHSGNRKWAPVWIRKIGCEWLFRMFTGGNRVFWRYVKHHPLFVYVILKQKVLSIGRK